MRWLIIFPVLLLILLPTLYLTTAERKDESPKYVWKPLQAKVTHYCWKEKAERRWKGKTSLNQSAKNESGVAVDPKLIPYGTQIYIPGIGLKTADDTGGKCRQFSRQGKVLIDVRWQDKTTKELKQIGSQWQTVYILQKAD